MNIDKLLEEGVIGFEQYPERKKGGQQCGIPIIGFRFYYPNTEQPDIDIRIRHSRSQLKNKRLAQTLLELALEGL